jgi:hypothetical protein
MVTEQALTIYVESQNKDPRFYSYKAMRVCPMIGSLMPHTHTHTHGLKLFVGEQRKGIKIRSPITTRVSCKYHIYGKLILKYSITFLGLIC